MKLKAYSTMGVMLISLFILGTTVLTYAQSRDPNNPTRMTSSQISGLINANTIGGTYYYSFFAGPGSFTAQVRVSSDQRQGSSSLKRVAFSLLNSNQSDLDSKTIDTFYGDAEQNQIGTLQASYTFSEKVILAVNIPDGFNKGSGAWYVTVGGTINFVGPDYTSVLSDSSKSTNSSGAVQSVTGSLKRDRPKANGSSDLHGTEWTIEDILPPVFVRYFLVFSDQDKASYKWFASKGSIDLKLGLNPSFNRHSTELNSELTMKIAPYAIATGGGEGSYTRNGDAVTLDFPDAVWTFTIKDNSVMNGKITYKNPNASPKERPFGLIKIYSP